VLDLTVSPSTVSFFVLFFSFQALAAKLPVQISLRIQATLSAIQVSTWQSAFSANVAKSLSIGTERVNVLSIVSGSVIVVTELKPSSSVSGSISASVTPAAAAASLAIQAQVIVHYQCLSDSVY
jgi:hypothetical protein